MKETNHGTAENFGLTDGNIKSQPQAFPEIAYRKRRTGKFKILDNAVNREPKIPMVAIKVIAKTSCLTMADLFPL